jgi:hypothetical protein
MYPLHVFNLFPPFPRTNRVFVAMSFGERFTWRWRDVIAPAIERVEWEETRLQAHRIDVRTISDSVVSEILQEISTSRLVLADLTTASYADTPEGTLPVRNGNVMYEIGLAQAVRLPEEVILFRSDKDRLLFDLSNVRVNMYSPDDCPEEAQSAVEQAVLNSLREIKEMKHMAVRRAYGQLDINAVRVLLICWDKGKYVHPQGRTMGDVLANVKWDAAVSRLLDLGAISSEHAINADRLAETKQLTVDCFMSTYKLTPFGEALCEAVRLT